MSAAPTKWRDALGREWRADGALGGYDMVRPVDGETRESWRIDTVRRLCGPLVPVEPMARVRIGVETYAGQDSDDAPVMQYTRCLVKRTIFPLARAEEIAAAFRTLGYADATVEVVE